MADPKFVIRGFHFGYNDECYYVCGHSVNSVYENEAEAEAKLRQMQLEYGRRVELGETAEFFDGDDGTRQAADAFIFERTGEHLLDKDGYFGRQPLPKKMSDDDVLTFLDKFGLRGYQLIKFDGEPKFYILYDNLSGAFDTDMDEYSESLGYSESAEGLIEKRLENFMYARQWESLELEGTYEELSETPTALASLVEDNKSLRYDAAKKRLVIKKARPKLLATVNGLLKEPIFSVRALSLEAVQQAEEALRKKMAEEYGDY